MRVRDGCVCVCVWVSVCLCVYMWACACIRVCVCKRAHMCVWKCVCTHTCICVCVCTCLKAGLCLSLQFYYHRKSWKKSDEVCPSTAKHRPLCCRASRRFGTLNKKTSNWIKTKHRTSILSKRIWYVYVVFIHKHLSCTLQLLLSVSYTEIITKDCIHLNLITDKMNHKWRFKLTFKRWIRINHWCFHMQMTTHTIKGKDHSTIYGRYTVSCYDSFSQYQSKDKHSFSWLLM